MAARRSAGGIVVVNSPAPRRQRARQAVRYVGRQVRRHGKRALPTVAVAIGGAVVGYLDGRGMLEALPEIGDSHMTTIGVFGYAVTRLSSNPSFKAAGLAMLGAAAFDFGRQAAAKNQPAAP